MNPREVSSPQLDHHVNHMRKARTLLPRPPRKSLTLFCVGFQQWSPPPVDEDVRVEERPEKLISCKMESLNKGS